MLNWDLNSIKKTQTWNIISCKKLEQNKEVYYALIGFMNSPLLDSVWCNEIEASEKCRQSLYLLADFLSSLGVEHEY